MLSCLVVLRPSRTLHRPPLKSPLFPYTTLFRSGLRFALAASEKTRVQLLVAGRGNQRKYRSDNVTFLGEMEDVRLPRSEEHTSELQSLRHLVCRLLLEKKNGGVIDCKLKYYYLI